MKLAKPLPFGLGRGNMGDLGNLLELLKPL
jgi:hypothetical protein